MIARQINFTFGYVAKKCCSERITDTFEATIFRATMRGKQAEKAGENKGEIALGRGQVQLVAPWEMHAVMRHDRAAAPDSRALPERQL